MGTHARVFFGIGLLLACLTSGLAAYLMTQVAQHDWETIHGATKTIRDHAHGEAQQLRRVVKGWLWIAALVSLIASSWGWIEFSNLRTDERTRPLLAIGIMGTALSAALTALFIGMRLITGGN